jgi:multiple sugar transport system permease protein
LIVVKRLIPNLFLLFVAGVVLTPFLWLILAPSKTGDELKLLPPMSFGSFETYRYTISGLFSFQNGVIYDWLSNSVIYTLAAMAIGIASALLAGYALAVIPIRGKRVILITVLIYMIIPTTALVLPLYITLDLIGLTDSRLGIILCSAPFPFGVFLAYIFFTTVVPREILESARLDGLSEWGVFLRLALRMSRPLWSLLIFFSFIVLWNSYQLPLMLLNSPELFPLPVGLRLGLSTGNALVGVLLILPAIFVFIGSQRSLARGIFGGSVKG